MIASLDALVASAARSTCQSASQYSLPYSPNDSVWHSSGWLYFTDPPYGRAGQEQDPLRELDFNGIYQMHPETGELELLEGTQSRPNGIALSPDERTLYVANSDASNKVWYRYEVTDNGEFLNQRIFFDVNDQDTVGAADGMKVDLEGNDFATGLYRFRVSTRGQIP